MSESYLIYSDYDNCEDCTMWLINKFDDSDENDTRCAYDYCHDFDIYDDLRANFIKYNLFDDNSIDLIQCYHSEILDLMHKHRIGIKIDKVIVEKKSPNDSKLIEYAKIIDFCLIDSDIKSFKESVNKLYKQNINCTIDV